MWRVYLHRTSPDLPPQIGVLVATDTDAEGVAKDVAMHIAAMSPTYLTRDDVPAEVVASERRIAEETAREEGKPEQALPRIVEGRVNGFFKDNVLLEQPFAKDNKKTVAAGPQGSRRQRHRVRPVQGRRLSRDAAPGSEGPGAAAHPGPLVTVGRWAGRAATPVAGPAPGRRRAD